MVIADVGEYIVDQQEEMKYFGAAGTEKVLNM